MTQLRERVRVLESNIAAIIENNSVTPQSVCTGCADVTGELKVMQGRFCALEAQVERGLARLEHVGKGPCEEPRSSAGGTGVAPHGSSLALLATPQVTQPTAVIAVAAPGQAPHHALAPQPTAN